MSHQEVHVAWLLQVRLTGITNTQTGRLVIVGTSKRCAQPVNQRGVFCHLVSSCNGSFHVELSLMRCEALHKKQLDITMRDNCCTSCVNDLRSGVFLTTGAHELTVWILTKKLIHHNNSLALESLVRLYGSNFDSKQQTGVLAVAPHHLGKQKRYHPKVWGGSIPILGAKRDTRW